MMIIYGDKINTPLEWSLPGEAVNKSILHFEERENGAGASELPHIVMKHLAP